jgi:zinc finger CCHC domain-containing protein 8
VRGSLLREALGLEDGQHDGEWLQNIAIWGYPRGWVGEEDPRDGIRRIIEGGNDVIDDNEELPLTIFGEEDLKTDIFMTSKDSKDEGVSDDGNHSVEESDSSSSSSSRDSDPLHTATMPPSRWATYPPTHFLTSLLPIYMGFALPPVVSTPRSVTFTDDRRLLWDRITSGPNSNDITMTGHKMHNIQRPSTPPPPPITEPPPLPPAISPPPSSGNPHPPPVFSMLPNDQDQELDMEMSDED